MMSSSLTLLLALMGRTLVSAAASYGPLTRGISGLVHDQEERPECLLCATTTGIRSSVTERASQQIESWEWLKNWMEREVGSKVNTFGGDQIRTLISVVGPTFHLDIRPMLLQSESMQSQPRREKVFDFVKEFLVDDRRVQPRRGNILLFARGEHWFWLKEYLMWGKKEKQEYPVYNEEALQWLQREHSLSRALRLREFRSKEASGHAMVIYDYNWEEQYYAIKNSWGQRSGFEKIGRDMMEEIWVDRHWKRPFSKPGLISQFQLAFLAKEDDVKRDRPFQKRYYAAVQNEAEDAQDPTAYSGIDQSMWDLEPGMEWMNLVQFPQLMSQEAVARRLASIGLRLKSNGD